jgi:hypothetical protein
VVTVDEIAGTGRDAFELEGLDKKILKKVMGVCELKE